MRPAFDNLEVRLGEGRTLDVWKHAQERLWERYGGAVLDDDEWCRAAELVLSGRMRWSTSPKYPGCFIYHYRSDRHRDRFLLVHDREKNAIVTVMRDRVYGAGPGLAESPLAAKLRQAMGARAA